MCSLTQKERVWVLNIYWNAVPYLANAVVVIILDTNKKIAPFVRSKHGGHKKPKVHLGTAVQDHYCVKGQ